MKNNLVVALGVLLLAGSCSATKLDDVAVTNPTATTVVQGGTADPRLLGQWNFEGSTPFQNLSELNAHVTIVADPLDPQNRVMKCTIPADEDRAEVSAGAPNLYFNANSNSTTSGKEFWIGFRVLKYSQAQNSFVSLFQIGTVDNPTAYPGKSSSGLYQLTNYDNTNQWTWRYYNSVFTDQPGIRETIAPLVDGQWERFVLHCVFSSGSDGLMEIWKNGVKVYTKPGPNAIAGSRTRVKWGTYIGVGNKAVGPITCFYDDVKIGGSTADYATVAP